MRLADIIQRGHSGLGVLTVALNSIAVIKIVSNDVLLGQINNEVPVN